MKFLTKTTQHKMYSCMLNTTHYKCQIQGPRWAILMCWEVVTTPPHTQLTARGGSLVECIMYINREWFSLIPRWQPIENGTTTWLSTAYCKEECMDLRLQYTRNSGTVRLWVSELKLTHTWCMYNQRVSQRKPAGRSVMIKRNWSCPKLHQNGSNMHTWLRSTTKHQTIQKACDTSSVLSAHLLWAWYQTWQNLIHIHTISYCSGYLHDWQCANHYCATRY